MLESSFEVAQLFRSAGLGCQLVSYFIAVSKSQQNVLDAE